MCGATHFQASDRPLRHAIGNAVTSGVSATYVARPRQDSNLQPSAPEADALSNWATGTNLSTRFLISACPRPVNGRRIVDGMSMVPAAGGVTNNSGWAARSCSTWPRRGGGSRRSRSACSAEVRRTFPPASASRVMRHAPAAQGALDIRRKGVIPISSPVKRPPRRSGRRGQGGLGACGCPRPSPLNDP